MRIVMAVLCMAAWSCADAAVTTTTSHTLRLARTTSNELAAALQRLSDIRVDVVSEGGSSITTLVDLKNGKTDMGVPVADVAYLAYAGQLDEIRTPFDQLRGLAVINLNTLHVLVAPDARISSLRDLRGLHVSLGAPGSSTALIAERLLEAHGIPAGSVRTERIPNTEMIKMLPGSEIDAAFVMYNPANAAAAAAMKSGVRLISVEGPVVEQMRTQYPYLKRTLLPPDTYPNQPEPVRTIGVDTILVCRADLDDDLVYRMLDAYFATLPAMTPPNFERAPATPIPLHRGAARFYRQRELSR